MKFTLCGSARFEDLWHEWNKKLGLMGHITYSLMTFPSIEGSKTWYTDDEKETLDLAHLAKIEESDAVFILNKDGYMGDSTRRELKWARMRNKKVYLLDAHKSPRGYYEDLSYQHIPGWGDYVAKYMKVLLISLMLTGTAFAEEHRSIAALNEFQHLYPCPSTGLTHPLCHSSEAGHRHCHRCPGYVIDHVCPFACGGADDPSNMNWQTIQDGRDKDKWELSCRTCTTPFR